MKILSSGFETIETLREFRQWKTDHKIHIQLTEHIKTNMVVFNFTDKDDALAFMLKYAHDQKICKVIQE